MIHRQSRRRKDERKEQINLKDYVIMNPRKRKSVSDAKIEENISVLNAVKMRHRWKFGEMRSKKTSKGGKEPTSESGGQYRKG